MGSEKRLADPSFSTRTVSLLAQSALLRLHFDSTSTISAVLTVTPTLPPFRHTGVGNGCDGGYQNRKLDECVYLLGSPGALSPCIKIHPISRKGNCPDPCSAHMPSLLLPAALPRCLLLAVWPGPGLWTLCWRKHPSQLQLPALYPAPFLIPLATLAEMEQRGVSIASAALATSIHHVLLLSLSHSCPSSFSHRPHRPDHTATTSRPRSFGTQPTRNWIAIGRHPSHDPLASFRFHPTDSAVSVSFPPGASLDVSTFCLTTPRPHIQRQSVVSLKITGPESKAYCAGRPRPIAFPSRAINTSNPSP